MAITKVFAIRVRLDDRVKYVTNGEKTTLDAGIAYAVNPEKTEQNFFVSTLNCSSSETAFSQMMDTKRTFGKTDGVLGYHFIQSFAPGEVTPEQAHAIGVEFSRQLFGTDFEVVIGTHLDKHHLHNHIVINSVSCADGRKYHSDPAGYYNKVRAISDAICRENELSVITPKGKGKHYAEWNAEQQGKPTIRSMIRDDIDSIISEAYTFQSFLMLLQKKGYVVKHGPNRKYTTVQPPGAKRAIRLDSLGEGYTEEAIKQRLIRQRSGGTGGMVLHTPTTVKRYRLHGKLRTAPKKKITGFKALYLRYLYLLHGSRRIKRRHRADFSLRQDLIRLEQYQKQFRYLMEQDITTASELEQRIAGLEWDIQQLTEQRKPLYYERRNTEDEQAKEQVSLEIDRHTASLREKRRELALCRRIQADIPQVSEQVRQAQEEQNEILRKEERQHEYQRRNR